MKALLQRVGRAAVAIGAQEIASISRGLLVFLCAEKGDLPDDLDYLVKKVSQIRIFSDAAGKMNLDLAQAGGEILLISQFTLVGNLRRGNRPSFSEAQEPALARQAVDDFAAALRRLGHTVKTGVFGAEMQVSLLNDGPVTLWLDSRQRLEPRP